MLFNKSSLKQYYKGKRLLVTGTTGFLGKVLLQKILYSLPDVELVYVLIRGKKGMQLLQRFKKQIVSSPCFDRIRTRYGNQFQRFIQQKVKPIQGDLHKDGLGLTESDYQELVNRCHIILNCAASIDFNARLDQAIESNIKGSLRMMQLAKQMKNLQIFTHVSTCYVNCNLEGFIRQQIYDGLQDPEQLFVRLTSMSTQSLVADTKDLLGNYPNTYTYTKALCQRLMRLRRGDLPLSIVRPAIINTSYLEPFPGWVDSVAAAAAYYMFVGLGIIKQIKQDPNKIADTIPVDIVVANILVATAYNSKNNKLSVYHVGSSDRNPFTIKNISQIIQDFWNSNLSQKRLSKPKLVYTQNALKIKTSQLPRKISISIYERLSPFLGSQHIKNAQKLIKAEKRAETIRDTFKYFINGQWIYQSRGVLDLSNWMSESDRQQFLVDVADIDMRYFITLNNYGIQKYILKENVDLPVPQNINLLKLNEQDAYFSDLKWSLADLSPKIYDNNGLGKQIKSKILGSSRVVTAIQQQILIRTQSGNKNYQLEKKKVLKEAQQIINQIIGVYRPPVINFMAWTLQKVFKRIFKKLNVNSQMLFYLKTIQSQRKIPIVLLPTHRSHLDFLIMSYIFFRYKLKLPYAISEQVLMNSYLIPFLIKNSGTFIFGNKRQSKLYKAIFNEYVQRLLINGNNLQFFIEGSISTTGKVQPPRPQILQILIQTVEQGMISDICLVPLTINYEKVLDNETFPQLFESLKPQQSYQKVAKAISLTKVNFGKVYVQFSEPIFMTEYLQAAKQKKSNITRNMVLNQLGQEIICRLNQKSVIMSTGIVSAVLLMYKNGVSEEQLIKTVNYLAKYIIKKGYKVGSLNQISSDAAVRKAIQYLQTKVEKKNKGSLEQQNNIANEFHKILMLSYYRNTIVQAFLPDAFIGCAIMSFGERLYQVQGVSFQNLKQQTIFLMQILSLEFIHPYNFNKRSNQFNQIMNQMIRSSIIIKDEQKYLISKQQNAIFLFYCSLIRTTIECYWAINAFFLTKINKSQNIIEVSSFADFYQSIQIFIQSLYTQKVLDNNEPFTLQIIKNCLKKYQQIKMISLKQINNKQVKIIIEYSAEELCQLQTHLSKFFKNINIATKISRTEQIKTTKKDINLFSKL